MKFHYVLLFIVLIFLTGCLTLIEEPVVHFEKEDGKALGDVFVELAQTPEERARGLMHRETLEERSGMLFIFEREDTYNFWMKNTLIPLDMIFISEDLRVVDIIQATPCEEAPCESYTPKEKALYVLEVNQGYAKNRDLEIEDKVIIYLP